MGGKICYLGDGSLRGAAGYLAAIMLHHGLEFDYVPSDASPPAAFSSAAYAAYVVSDYPASRFGPATMGRVVEAVEQGAGLVMLGGWESFFGRLGEYHASALADVLPVLMHQSDDRRNCAQPCLIRKAAEHPIVAGLPWDAPPGIGGFNALAAKRGTVTVLEAVQFSVHQSGEEFQFARGQKWPLLVVGQHGRGRTAALAVDVAPHWVGGLVDWGDGRVVEEVAGETIEIGNWYARFFANLLAWAGNLVSHLRAPTEGWSGEG
jgi:uncharacterized membrane protein